MRIVTVFLFAFFLSSSALANPAILDVAGNKEITFPELILALKEVQVVLIGEGPEEMGHHLAQLEIIRSLHEEGRELVLGLEMFRADSQADLDLWTTGDMGAGTFRRAFERNWTEWDHYERIFRYARDNRIPLLGLNLSREIIRRVSEKGFQSLTPAELGDLGGISCIVDRTYEDAARQSRMLGDARGVPSFLFFCEAQVLGDIFMARNLLRLHAEKPGPALVVLAGSNHCWKPGIPSRLALASDLSYRVILPEEKGRLDRTSVKPSQTDYLWLNTGTGGWRP